MHPSPPSLPPRAPTDNERDSTVADGSDAMLQATSEMARREQFHHRHQPDLDVEDHTVLLVDDGTTRGSTLRAAIRLLRRQRVERVIEVRPAASRHGACDLGLQADDLMTLTEPAPALAIGNWFKPCSLSTAADQLGVPVPDFRLSDSSGQNAHAINDPQEINQTTC